MLKLRFDWYTSSTPSLSETKSVCSNNDIFDWNSSIFKVLRKICAESSFQIYCFGKGNNLSWGFDIDRDESDGEHFIQETI